jgi:hypothetical protein
VVDHMAPPAVDAVQVISRVYRLGFTTAGERGIRRVVDHMAPSAVHRGAGKRSSEGACSWLHVGRDSSLSGDST